VSRHPHPLLSPAMSAATAIWPVARQAQMTVTRLPVGSTHATVQAPNCWPTSMALMAATVPVAAVDGLIRVNAGQRLNIMAMIRIAITAEAFEAIASTLLLGTVGYENEANERGRAPDLA
jgi:hypothetical protein